MATPLGARPPAAVRDGARSAFAQQWTTLLLVVAAVAPFVVALRFGFVYDDTWIVQHNPATEGWRSLLTLWSRPYWSDAQGAAAGLYRPLETACFAVIRNAGGGWPLWFHAWAILLHAAVTLLVWRLLRRGVGATAAVVGALWFAVHPLHVEAIASPSNSAEALVALFTLLLAALLARCASAGRASWSDAIAAALLYAAAMLSKESGAMSFAIATVIAWWWRAHDDARMPTESEANARGTTPRGTTSRVATARAWIFDEAQRWWPVVAAGASAIVVVLAMRVHALGSARGAAMAAVGIDTISPWRRIVSMLSLGPRVLALLFWPGSYQPYFGPSAFPTGALGAAAAAVTVLAIGALAAWVVRSLRSPGADRRALAALLVIVLAFLPASNLLVATGQILAERTLYLSSVGAAMLVALLAERLSLALRGVTTAGRRAAAGRVARLAALGVAALVAARGAVASHRGTLAWRTHGTLIAQMIAADPDGYRGHYLLALESARRGDSTAAARAFATAYALYPADPQLDVDYARFLLATRRAGDAVAVTRTLEVDERLRNDADALGVYFDARGMAFGADSVLAAALRLERVRPHPTIALYRGIAHEARAEPAAALEAYRSGLRLAPGDPVLAQRAAAAERAVAGS